MKIVRLAAAAALALTPALSLAEGTTAKPASTVEPGGTAQGPLPVFAAGAIPFEAIIVGSFVIVGGAVVGTIAATQSDSDSVAVSTSTN